jgi:hypothetical protein
LLQDYFVQEWADNFVMHMMVTNLDQWWAAVSGLNLESRYAVRAPRPPKGGSASPTCSIPRGFSGIWRRRQHSKRRAGKDA